MTDCGLPWCCRILLSDIFLNFILFVMRLCNSYNCSMIYVNTNMEDMYVF